MILEFLFILILLGGGALALSSLGIRGWVALPFGFLASTTGYITLAYVQLYLGLSTSPLITMVVTAFTLLGITLYRVTKSGSKLPGVKTFLAVILSVLVLVTFFRVANLTKYHFDPFRYIITGSLLARDNVEHISTNLLTKRLSSVSIIHAPADIVGDFYLSAFTPILSLSVLCVVFWAIKNFLIKERAKSPKIVLAAAPLLLISNYGYVWHSFYLNGHLLFGANLLLAVVAGWQLLQKNKASFAYLVVMCLALMGIVFTRQEAPLVAALAALPFVLSKEIRLSYRLSILWSLAAAIVIKYGYITLGLYKIQGSFNIRQTDPLFLFGLLLFLASPLLALKLLTKWGKLWVRATEGLLWVTLAIFSLRQPEILKKSVWATWENLALGAGGWGYSLLILGVLVVLVSLFTRFKHDTYFRFPVTTFVPLVFLLAFLRESEYRVGVTDSLNRMWVQVLPLAVVYVVLALALGKPRFKFMKKYLQKV